MHVTELVHLSILAALVLIILHLSTTFERSYGLPLAHLYTLPWWRLLLTFALVAALSWCPWVGVLFGAVLFFYFSDMAALIQPIPNL